MRAERASVLDAAYAAHPDRFVNGAPTPPALPGPAWINKPKKVEGVMELVTQSSPHEESTFRWLWSFGLVRM